MDKIPSGLHSGQQNIRYQLQLELRIQSEKCIDCKLCRRECSFLQKYGSPKHIADTYDPASPNDHLMPFECSLCGLCAAVCPVKINPPAMFLEMRRQAVDLGTQDFADYGGILNYQRCGTSRLYSYYALPKNCSTVLFPGCTLSGTRPDRVKDLYDHLQTTIPHLGIVLDCCTKPSHDLGQEKHFHSMFGEMYEYLLQHGVETLLVACPNCYRVFKQYSEGLQVKTVYEHFIETSWPSTANIAETVTIHDPCVTRNEVQIHAAIRQLIKEKSMTVREMKHHGPKTLCCGEGGSVGCVYPDYKYNWGAKRKEEAHGIRTLTYCAGCAHILGSLSPTDHILDVLFDPEATLEGKINVSKAPWTYLNRLRLKNHFRRKLKAVVSRERTFTGEERPKGSHTKRIILLLLLVTMIVAVRMSGAMQFLEQERLRTIIQSYGALAPIIYMLTYAVAPALFLPGLPLTIVGGILFGPFWGVFYTIIGSTVGASVAFLISRTIGREWFESELKSTRWKRLDAMVENHGWKAVALTRLIPLFPFNLLNYAFGLTKVKFLHYALATFFCMLPACIAFIVFSSSLLNMLQGKVTPQFLVGITLIILVSLFPIFYRRAKSRNTIKVTMKNRK
jgi:uncharacterized membrane protein YdjX (TVP38/TMEM64 family)/Fe-S oxidoreductase